MSKPVILWDLDGTIIDSEKEIIDTIVESFRLNRVPIQNAGNITIGPPVDIIVEKILLQNDIREIDSSLICKTFRDLYDSSSFSDTKIFNGIVDLLNFAQSGFDNFVLTNKPIKPTMRILDRNGLFPYFKGVFSPDCFVSKMNKGDMVLQLIDAYSFHKESTVLIGDTVGDFEASVSSGIGFIGVGWGAGAIELEKKKSLLMKNIDELLDKLKLIENGEIND